MNINSNDSLQKIFARKLSRREVTWLWLQLRLRNIDLPVDQQVDLSMAQFGTERMRDQMAAFFANWRRTKDSLDELRNETLLPEHELEWVKNDRRLLNWLLYKLREEYVVARYTPLPNHLSFKETFLALVDLIDLPAESKITLMRSYRADWAQIQDEDTHITRIIGNGNEKINCSAAWDWYRKNHPNKLLDTPRFSDLNSVLLFLDTSGFKLDEKRFHLNEIKKYLRMVFKTLRKGCG